MNLLRYLVFCIILIFGVHTEGKAQQKTAQQTDTRPNILLVFVDDLDHQPLGFMGNEIIQTPHIDQLAAEGVVFQNAFATTATCVTSRGTLMTGRYAARTGIYFDQFDGLTEEQADMSFPAQLRQSGYHTGYVGKWHLGTFREGLFDDDRAYDGQGQFWSEEHPPGRGSHLTDRLGNQAVSMIHDAPGDKPFAVTVGFKAPHVQDGFHPVEPYPASPATAVLYERDEIPAPPLSDSAFFDSQPDFLKKSLNRVRWNYRLGPPESLNFQRSMRRYYRMVTGIDRQLGKMMEALRETNRLENTIIVLTSDHGMYLGDRGFAGKWLGHDTAIRIPFIVRDPRLREAETGTEREQMVLMIDLLPTFLDWAGLSPQDGVQGHSFAPIVAGGDTDDWRSEFFYEHHSFPDRIPRSEGVRTERYKYLRYPDSEPLYEELYDLREDPHESDNLAGDPDHARLLRQMRDKWSQWRKRVR
ncbi:Arylsulfatase A [Fodinibius roseus]|uniref:Arylsulfatase A n=1 Tax=Fodinibius roseus TaxID=1194090 RepID=A0A1M5AX24_9BACT|nr:sulfatase [Fodinibius roseus]SHF34472.1 Arylsulfatase A [Fodinibius roseus]